MDLVDALRTKIDVLGDGEYLPGLKAVLLHIETAFRHLSRGQASDDDTAFTDAIYRTNQAFEGSIKEAYRVLAGQDPAKKSPYQIESYLERNKIFRPRVLSQLTTYRTEWRNPSAHDYRLDFDESEAFLAIVSVSAFACLLLDQIAERLAYAKSQAEVEARQAALSPKVGSTTNPDLLVLVTELLTQFCAFQIQDADASLKSSEAQVIGAIHGFLAATAPDLEVVTDARLDPERPFRADILVSRGGDRLLIDLKRLLLPKNYADRVAEVEHRLLIGRVKSGVLLFLPDVPGEMERLELTIPAIDGRLVVLSPLGSNPRLKRAAQ